jgi:T-complex protein 1 subunit epsilon
MVFIISISYFIYLNLIDSPFEPPKPKTKHNINISNAEDYKKMYAQEQKYFVDMVQAVKKSGANIVMC